MLILSGTAHKVQVITDAAVTVDTHASFVKRDATTSTAENKNTNITTATTTDITGSPATGEQWTVKTIIVNNKHASTSVAVTVELVSTSVTSRLIKLTLNAGETLQYFEGEGWFVLDASGNIKNISATPVLQIRALAGDASNSSATPAEVTGLKVILGVGTYIFRYTLRYQSTASGTGVRFSANFDGTVTSFVQQCRWVDASATASTAAPDQDAVGAAGQVMGAMAGRVKSVAGLGTTISVDTQDADMMMILEGMMVVTVAGELELWHGSEGAVATKVMAGSVVEVLKAA